MQREDFTKQYIYSKQFLTDNNLTITVDEARKVLSLVGIDTCYPDGRRVKEDPFTWDEDRVWKLYKSWRKEHKELLYG